MNRILPLRGQIQEYAWGSRSVLAELLGRPSPSATPEAELWFGAHPRAPSFVQVEGTWSPLSELIEAHPEEVLGPRVARCFERKLPFLLKVIAAETALSIQAHPDADQARRGYERENALGIPLDAPNRSYKDPNSKPELLCATSRFVGLCGFRSADEIHATITALHSPTLDGVMAPFLGSPRPDTWRTSFGRLLLLPGERRERLIAEVGEAARPGGSAEQRWFLKLRQDFANDVGVLAPLFLNLLELEPGEAIFLGPGEPHAYLRGVAVEIMSNSDNVLRGGLTPKHVDIPELLRTLSFSMGPVSILRPGALHSRQMTYRTPAREFQLFAMHLQGSSHFESEDERNVEILFCSEGSARITQAGEGPELRAQRGTAWLVPASAPLYRIEGTATFYRATVP